jgi:hypothetical protein
MTILSMTCFHTRTADLVTTPCPLCFWHAYISSPDLEQPRTSLGHTRVSHHGHGIDDALLSHCPHYCPLSTSFPHFRADHCESIGERTRQNQPRLQLPKVSVCPRSGEVSLSTQAASETWSVTRGVFCSLSEANSSDGFHETRAVERGMSATTKPHDVSNA